MNILITSQNIPFFRDINPKLKIHPYTKNTSIIRCSEKTFVVLRNELRAKGLNPYTFMAW